MSAPQRPGEGSRPAGSLHSQRPAPVKELSGAPPWCSSPRLPPALLRKARDLHLPVVVTKDADRHRCPKGPEADV